MSPHDADEIAYQSFQEFVRTLERFAADRDSLLRIKDSVENGRRDATSPENRRWMNRKLQEVDTYLRRVKQVKNPGLKKTGGLAAWWITVVNYDPEDKTKDYFSVATMLNPAEFIARHCREAKHPEEIPVILAFFQQPDIDSIPLEIWDDTCPNNNRIEGSAGAPAESQAS